MAYQIEKTYTSFWGGISDDDFLGSEYAVKDLDWIDVQTQERYAQCEPSFFGTTLTSLSGGANWVKESTIYSFFASNDTTLQLNWTSVALWGSSAYWVDTYGLWLDEVHYIFCNNKCRKTDNSGTLITDITTWYPTLSSYTYTYWHITNLLFSVGNTIRFIDTVNNVCSTSVLTLTPWTIVKGIYAYSIDSIVVVWVNGYDTFIYELEFTGGAYNIVRKLPIIGYRCEYAVWDNYNVYWVSKEWIHIYQGWQSQFVKKVSLSALKWISFDKVLYILSWDSLYTYGSKKPLRNAILTRNIQDWTFITRSYLILNSWSGYYWKTRQYYKLTNKITLLPFDWGNYQIPKTDLNFRFWYIFPKWDWTPETDKAGITLKIQTDEMERQWDSFVTVWTWATNTAGYIEVYPNDIITALWADYSNEFGYVNIEITLTAWKYTWITGAYWKTPKLFDFTARANFVKNL